MLGQSPSSFPLMYSFTGKILFEIAATSVSLVVITVVYFNGFEDFTKGAAFSFPFKIILGILYGGGDTAGGRKIPRFVMEQEHVLEAALNGVQQQHQPQQQHEQQQQAQNRIDSAAGLGAIPIGNVVNGLIVVPQQIQQQQTQYLAMQLPSGIARGQPVADHMHDPQLTAPQKL